MHFNALILTAILATAPFDDLQQLDALPPSLSQLFHRSEIAVISDDGMVMFEPPADNVVVARTTDDGQLVTGCFATETAMRRFLDRNHRVESPAAQDK